MATFSLDMRRSCNNAQMHMDNFVRGVMLTLAKKVVKRSPVGDATYWQHPAPPGYVGGHFRGNWQYGFGSAPGGEVSDIDPDGDATLSKFDGINQIIGVHYIVNNLPYAQALEDGHSWHQAPFGMVGLAMAEINSELDAIAREASR